MGLLQLRLNDIDADEVSTEILGVNQFDELREDVRLHCRSGVSQLDVQLREEDIKNVIKISTSENEAAAKVEVFVRAQFTEASAKFVAKTNELIVKIKAAIHGVDQSVTNLRQIKRNTASHLGDPNNPLNKKAYAIIACLGLSFFMLFLSLASMNMPWIEKRLAMSGAERWENVLLASITVMVFLLASFIFKAAFKLIFDKQWEVVVYRILTGVLIFCLPFVAISFIEADSAGKDLFSPIEGDHIDWFMVRFICSCMIELCAGVIIVARIENILTSAGRPNPYHMELSEKINEQLFIRSELKGDMVLLCSLTEIAPIKTKYEENFDRYKNEVTVRYSDKKKREELLSKLLSEEGL